MIDWEARNRIDKLEKEIVKLLQELDGMWEHIRALEIGSRRDINELYFNKFGRE